MPPHSAHTASMLEAVLSPRTGVDGLAVAHARALQRAVAGEFQRRVRRTPFATVAAVCDVAAALMEEFARDLLNDLTILAERQGTAPAEDWVMARLTQALVEGTSALEEAAPPAARRSVAGVLRRKLLTPNA